MEWKLEACFLRVFFFVPFFIGIHANSFMSILFFFSFFEKISLLFSFFFFFLLLGKKKRKKKLIYIICYFSKNTNHSSREIMMKREALGGLQGGRHCEIPGQALISKAASFALRKLLSDFDSLKANDFDDESF